MKKRFIIAAFLAVAVSCEDIAGNKIGGYQEQEVPDTSPVCVFEFTDERGNSVDVTKLIISSDVLEDSPVIIGLEQPSEMVKVKLTPEVKHIATYQFLVTASDGQFYKATKDLYIPEGKRYEKTIALKSAWSVVKIAKGLDWYNYEGFEPVTCQNQVINVLEMDLDSESLKLEFMYYPDREKISAVGKSSTEILAVTNASFGSGFTSGLPVDNTYIRINGVTYKEIGIGPEDTGNWWKHEAAVWFDGDDQIGFIGKPGDPAGALELYKGTTYRNLLSSNTMLIEDGVKSDLSAYSRNFASSSSLEPRTLLALTGDRKLLLMTIDGRWTDKAAGMSYIQMQEFLMTHFKPRYAINMDGGGSTGMYIKDNGRNSTDVVNYPCEGNSSSKYYQGTTKERSLVTYFAIKER